MKCQIHRKVLSSQKCYTSEMFLKFSSSICRVCLGAEAELSLFADSGNDQKFMSATNLQVTEDDGLPTSLCVRCSDRLESAYEFKRQSLASDFHLRSFFNTINSKFASEMGNLYQKYDQDQAAADVKTEDDFADRKRTSLEIDTISDRETLSENGSVEKVQKDEVVSLDYSYIEAIDVEENKEEVYIERNNSDHEENHDEETSEYLTDRRSSLNVCRICSKCFSNRTNLTRHTLTHSNVKPYECLVCHSTFTQNGSLKQHMLRHTGERPHTCVTCGKGFTRRRLLVMHERIHTGEKPFRCGECNLYFTVKEGLRRHNIRKHSAKLNEVYTCDICEKKLHSKYTFRNHIKLHHRVSSKKRASFDPIHTTDDSYELLLDEASDQTSETTNEEKMETVDET